MNRFQSPFSCLLIAVAMAVLTSCDSGSSSGASDGRTDSITSGSGGSEGSGGTWNKSDFGIPWNSSITYGTLIDSRDGQVYRTVKIGTQTWMAENLNYKVDSSWCYGGNEDSCTKYGRMYQWTAAMGIPVTYTSSVFGEHWRLQGVCPADWHVPSDSEWTILLHSVDSATAGVRLKSVHGWDGSGNGRDTYGFRIVPAGKRHHLDGEFKYVGSKGEFWTSIEDTLEVDLAVEREACSGCSAMEKGGSAKNNGYPIRCVKDN